tara:strand:+ start:550 stop:1398 length:849 start_codon:yes stop_codon:yes gene_type:complete
MNLTEAYNLIDLLLDKADQPYFTTPEKDRFLKIAISDFVNFHYQKMLVDEDSRRALAPLIDYNFWSLTPSDIVSGAYIYNNSFPSFSRKYTDSGTLDQTGTVVVGSTHSAGNESTRVGIWLFGNQYVLPNRHLYVISATRKNYNMDDIIDKSTGLPFPGITSSDIKTTDWISIKNKSRRDYIEDSYSDDPFNQPSHDSPDWAYVENRIGFSDADNMRALQMNTITLPNLEEAFADVQIGEETYGATALPGSRVFTNHFQRQIIELAVDKMTKVDVGLMTPPS